MITPASRPIFWCFYERVPAAKQEPRLGWLSFPVLPAQPGESVPQGASHDGSQAPPIPVVRVLLTPEWSGFC